MSMRYKMNQKDRCPESDSGCTNMDRWGKGLISVPLHIRASAVIVFPEIQ
jgi:hypothetical protein